MKAVIFDFDGTLTEKNGNLWKKIWSNLGYEVDQNSYYKSLVEKFMQGKITHADWCVLTCRAYQEKGFKKRLLDDLADNIKLMEGAEELIKYLASREVEVHVVSGNIVSVIERVLNHAKQYITKINANNFVFNSDGSLDKIVGTKYDFEGKSTYIKELCAKKGFDPSEILFIGNSSNDEWVHESGAKTLCVNPDETNSDDAVIWNNVIKTDDLMTLKEFIFNE
ncbi:MAG: HAD family hydrolase [Clostridiales bacterium]|nr:HAD family hydrolase [Clostridiales bacterium]